MQKLFKSVISFFSNTALTLLNQLQDAVIASQDISQAFNDEVLAEHIIFQRAKRIEMKSLLGLYADGQIALYKQSITGMSLSSLPLIRALD